MDNLGGLHIPTPSAAGGIINYDGFLEWVVTYGFSVPGGGFPQCRGFTTCEFDPLLKELASVIVAYCMSLLCAHCSL